MSPHTSQTDRAVILAALLAAVSCLVYWPALEHGYFALDDKGYVYGNRHVLTGLTWDNLLWAFTSFHEANWHPLTWISHMADIQLFGPDPHGQHLTSVLIHALNGALLLLVLFRLSGSIWRSAFCAALFALHPLRVESVAWIAERKDVLSGLFFLLTLLAYLRHVRHPTLPRYLAVVALFACGLMAKPMLVTLPFLLLLLDWWPLSRCSAANGQDRPARLWLEKVPLLALSAVSSVITYQAQQQGGSVASMETLPVIFRLENALVSYAAYLAKALAPSGLAVFYPLSLPIPGWRIAGALVLQVVMGVAVYRWRKTRPWLAVGWLWYLGMLVPVIGLVHVGLQAMADRYTYLPLIGISIMIAWSLPAPGTRAATPAAFCGLLLAALLAWSGRQQLAYWRDNVTLFSHTAAVTDNNHLAEYYLGDALLEQGSADLAIRHFSRSLMLKPYQPDAHNGLGMAQELKGNLERAAVHYRAAIELRPALVEAHYNLGLLRLKERKPRDAAERFREVLRLRPEFVEARYALGIAQSQQGLVREARQSFSRVLDTNPSHDGARKALLLLEQASRSTPR